MSDLHRMVCDDFRDGVSARLDAEDLPPGLTADALDRHLATCAGCGAFAAGATTQHRSLRVRRAEPVPDLTLSILASLPEGARPRQVRSWPRYCLLAVGLTQLILALPHLLLGHDPGASIHVAREIGSFDIALAVGLLWAAWQPRRAAGLLPSAVALAGTTIMSAALDATRGTVPLLGEAHHVLDLAGVACLWALARPLAPKGTTPSALVAA